MKRVAVLAGNLREFRHYADIVRYYAGELVFRGPASFDAAGHRFDYVSDVERLRGLQDIQLVIIGGGFQSPNRQLIEREVMSRCRSGSMWFDTGKGLNGNKENS